LYAWCVRSSLYTVFEWIVFILEFKSVGGRSFRVSERYLEFSKSGVLPRDVCPLCGSKGYRVMKVTASNHVDFRF